MAANKLLNAIRSIATGGFAAFGVFNAGFGYANGGTIAQITSKATGVIVNAWCGQITTFNDALNATTSVTFVVTNNRVITGNEEVTVWLKSGGTLASYSLVIEAVAAGSFTVTIRNYTAGPLSEALVIGFAIRPAAIA